MGIAWNIEGCLRTGKNLPFTVWIDCQIVSGISKGRHTIGAVRGGELYA